MYGFQSTKILLSAIPCLALTIFRFYFQPLNWQRGGGGVLNPHCFFSLKFLPIDQLPNAFAQLFLDNEDTF